MGALARFVGLLQADPLESRRLSRASRPGLLAGTAASQAREARAARLGVGVDYSLGFGGGWFGVVWGKALVVFILKVSILEWRGLELGRRWVQKRRRLGSKRRGPVFETRIHPAPF